MKKIILVTILTLLLVVSLTGCAGFSPISPTPGEWNNRVFTSEYLGFHFVLPAFWDIPTDEQVLMILDVATDFLDDAGAESADAAVDSLYMIAISAATGANVNINYERLPLLRAVLGISRSDIFENVTNQFEAIGARITENSGTTRIGGHDWYSASIEMDVMGASVQMRQFYSAHGGYLRSITITYVPGVEELSDILHLFSDIDDPVPVAVPAEHADVLLGTWFWLLDLSYTYEFQADGTGVRGFVGERESFQWRTYEDTLLIETALGTEGWTFSVVGDIFSIESLLVQGMSFSYIREEATMHVDPELDAEEFMDIVINPDLIGTWAWDEDESYVYLFYDDGFGERGFSGAMDIFEWGTEGDDHLLMYLWGVGLESWTFTIDDDVLTLANRQTPDLIFSYIRQP
ncbi:MAG: hypothetical protein FWC20_01115 [Oscillospiraceae bacterium]|nr:hypothetical protein [Oscillospiraceae bacterium]MCL2277993.1 hypothetical protein [Oscillospiraceae bacterium]